MALTPDGVRELVAHGHRVRVEQGAGDDSSITDAEFAAAGAESWPPRPTPGRAELVVKVKEPQPGEFAYLRPDLVLFTYLHLAAYPRSPTPCSPPAPPALAYETVQLADGRAAPAGAR